VFIYIKQASIEITYIHVNKLSNLPDDGTRQFVAEWFKFLRGNSEEDIIKRLKHNKELESKPIMFCK